MALQSRTTKALHRSKVRKIHAGWLLFTAALLLTLLGVEAISTTRPDTAARQFALGIAGIAAAFSIAFVPQKRYRQASWWLYAIGLFFLVFLLLPFVPDSIVHPRNGARRWINTGFIDMQPSELMKIAFVFAMASHLRFRSHYRKFNGLILALFVAIPPMFLILIEPDLGTAMLFLPALISMVVAAGAKYRHLLIIGLLSIIAAGSMYPILKPHQKDRIQALIAQVQGDDRFEQTIGYQGARAMTLIGAGQVTGVGKAEAGELLRANHLPEEHNDMIFAVIVLRWGFVGSLLVWGLYLLFALGGLIAAVGCKDPFPRLVAVGLTTMVISQMIINSAMTLGLAPITGLTLPFVSAGGSSLVIAWLMAGILFGIAMRRDPAMTREGFQFSEEGIQ
ncbi:MAG: FtsW/RodA/SpoVE family cell cycle protein [Phycisphaerae bacterium]|nr:FtsW/RodA/SpoVE family cell cycle protein [Phycisphaerae bacterium]MBT5409316.1 FtsW/RodA/SpoVE family cell cycle protein [Phycisphaerae bacterium]